MKKFENEQLSIDKHSEWLSKDRRLRLARVGRERKAGQEKQG